MRSIKILVIGHFGLENELFNGQTIKTKILFNQLSMKYGDQKVKRLDTSQAHRNIFAFSYHLFSGIKNSNYTFLLPASRGIWVIIPLAVIFNFFLKRKIIYVVIGAWLGKYSKFSILKFFLKKLFLIVVETAYLIKELERQGIYNVITIPNFKILKPIDSSYISKKIFSTYNKVNICFFSRVSNLKGVEIAIESVILANKRVGRDLFKLDIYGQIEKDYLIQFSKLQLKFPNFIEYKGIVSPEKSVKTLTNYIFMLFPTKYLTEGIPGTIIDGFAAGLVIIASNWNSAKEMIKDGENGFVCDVNNSFEISSKILFAFENEDLLYKIRLNSLKSYLKYSEKALFKLYNLIY